jgi:hypothetical protein
LINVGIFDSLPDHRFPQQPDFIRIFFGQKLPSVSIPTFYVKIMQTAHLKNGHLVEKAKD